MRVVVTGAASFIGSPLVLKLIREGHEVLAVLRPSSLGTARFEQRCGRELFPVELARLTEVELDVQKIEDLPGLLGYSGREIGKKPWDAWVHLGWSGAGSENRARADLQRANVTQTLAALKTASALGCKKFLFSGSQAEYGIRHELTAETAPLHPVSEYGKAKVAVEEAAVPLSRELGISYIHARIFSVYGPGDHEWSLVNSCLSAWKRGEGVSLGPCTQIWNFLHVDDAVAALGALMQKGRAGFYNVAGEETKPLRAFIEEMAKICGSQSLYVFGDRQPNAEGNTELIPDLSKIREETGWAAKVTFEEGIRGLWQAMTRKPA